MADSVSKSFGRRFFSSKTRGAVVAAAGVIAVVAPFLLGSLAIALVGWLVIGSGVLEMFETFQAPNERERRANYMSGTISLVVGFLLLSQPALVVDGLVILLAISFFLDGASTLWSALWNFLSGEPWRWPLVRGLGDFIGCVVLATGWPVSGLPVVALLVGGRMIGVGWSLFQEKAGAGDAKPPESGLYPDARLRLPAHAHFAELIDGFDKEDATRRPYDVGYAWIFVLVFFAIHVGRMSVEWNFIGFLGPFVAVLGDIGTALVIAFMLIMPGRLGWRRLTSPLERVGWNRALAAIDRGDAPRWRSAPARWWLKRRMRFAHALNAMRVSPVACCRWGLRVGLPVTALLIALNPIWGFSWYFNSENWASGVWNSWAERRTDSWREAMIDSVREAYAGDPVAPQDLFRLNPSGIADGKDFSFLLIGDTGEGDASQHCLRDQFLALGERPDVKFLVVSSDVIYPAGAMSDYEAKFYLPFKGFTKPIYAIPGNHDWFDANEGFNANFLEPKAAKASMLARVTLDKRLTTTTDARIDTMIAEAARLRKEFGIRNGLQRGPFFDIQTDDFAFVAIDTGVMKTIDPKQEAWLKETLVRAKGKFLFVLLGHPLYAGGRYQGDGDEPFAALHRLLKDHDARIIMAGDTHDYEHYLEKLPSDVGGRTIHHFVNGGGGAYLSIGTPLDWPRTPAVPDCSYYPRKDQLIAKFDQQLPLWKQPLWYWVKDFRAWPSTAEAMAGAFDNNRAPFFQSFVEVKVRPSAGDLRIILHGANGPLRWRDLQLHGAIGPEGSSDDDGVEIVFRLKSP